MIWPFCALVMMQRIIQPDLRFDICIDMATVNMIARDSLTLLQLLVCFIDQLKIQQLRSKHSIKKCWNANPTPMH